MKKVIILVILLGLIAYHNKAIDKSTKKWLPCFITNKHTPVKWENNDRKNGLPSKGEFNAVNCLDDTTNKICLAAGSSGAGEPLLAISRDHGMTWTTKIAHNTPAEALKNGILYEVSCSGHGANAVCAAVGQYRFGADPLPTLAYLAVSNDSGTTWQIKNTPGIEILRSVSCSKSGDHTICAAVGGDKILISNDNGNHFKIKPIKDSVAQPGLSQVSCFGSACIAVGSAAFYPLIVTSKDNGNTWHINRSANLTTKDFSNGLATISCANSNNHQKPTCIAGGIYASKPTILVSHDQGATWHLNKSATITKLAPHGCLQMIKCLDGDKNAICIAESVYEGNTPTPITMLSVDSGDNWQITKMNNLCNCSRRH